MKPLIGITTGEIRNLTSPWSPITYGQSHTYSDAVLRANGIPVLIPMTDNIEVLQQLYMRLDGILLAGGNDIDPKLYKQQKHPKTKDVSPLRDICEVQLITWALADNKPIFAICRGMQLLNVVLGGTLHQNIADALPETADHEYSTRKQDITLIAHHLVVEDTSRLSKIIASTSLLANSHHHQAIDKLAESLVMSAKSEDGLIEAIEKVNSTFVIGVQCHPESLQEVEPKWNLVFSSFVASAAQQR